MKPKYHSLNPSFLRYGALPLLLATSSLIVPAMAQTVIDWKSNAATTAWATGSNWVGESAPANSLTGNIAQFNQSAYTSQPNYGTTSVAGIIVGNGSTAVGNLTLSGTQLNIGASGIDIKAQSGTVALNNAARLGASQTWANNSGSLFTVGATISNVGNTTPFTLTIDGSGNTTTTASITNGGATGTTAIIKNGSGILTLSNTGTNTNTFTGGLTINAGTVRFGTATLNPANQLGTGSVTIGGSSNTVIDYIGANSTVSTVTGWTLQGAGTVTRANTGNGIGWGTAKITGSSGGLIYTASNAANVIQVGAVTSDYTGGTTLQSGMIVMNGASNADTTTTGTFGNASGASNVLTFGGASIRGGASTTNRTISNNLSFAADTTHAATSGGLAGTLTWAGETTLNGTGSVRQFTQASLTQDWVFSNVIKNGTVSNFTVNITGSRSVTFSGANTFDGTLLATGTGGGGLALGHVNAVQNATLDTGSTTASRAVTFTAAGTNTYNIGALQGADDLDIGANTLSVGAKAVDTSFTGAISGSGGLTKVGANKLTLSGTNTYAGATTIEAGTLYVTGALSNSAVTVGANGTIGSNGSAGGLANGLTINAGGNLDLTGATINTNSTGVLSLTGGSLTLGALTFQDLVGWDWLNAAEGTYELIDGSFSINWGSTVYLSAATAYDFGNGKKGYFTSGSLQAVIIPEPSAALLGGLGLLVLLRRRR
jgi:autotransporter-associated beta strand protein